MRNVNVLLVFVWLLFVQFSLVICDIGHFVVLFRVLRTV